MAGIEDCYTASRGNTKTQVGWHCVSLHSAIVHSRALLVDAHLKDVQQYWGCVACLLQH